MLHSFIVHRDQTQLAQEVLPFIAGARIAGRAMARQRAEQLTRRCLEVLAALFNGVSLLAIALGIFWEGYQRWQAPVHVRSVELLVIAVIGLAVLLWLMYTKPF